MIQTLFHHRGNYLTLICIEDTREPKARPDVGDSGGPLVVKFYNKTLLVGIISGIENGYYTFWSSELIDSVVFKSFPLGARTTPTWLPKPGIATPDIDDAWSTSQPLATKGTPGRSRGGFSFTSAFPVNVLCIIVFLLLISI